MLGIHRGASHMIILAACMMRDGGSLFRAIYLMLGTLYVHTSAADKPVSPRSASCVFISKQTSSKQFI